MGLPIDFDKTGLDVSKVFLTFMMTVGDVERTALALDMDPAVVEALAEQEDWRSKIRRLTVLSKSEKPGDFERASNRALNYVQAHQLRKTIDAVMLAVRARTPTELLAAMESTDKNGKAHLSGRFLADIAKAMEAVHSMSYAALSDTATERKDQAKTEDENADAGSIHSAVIAALNSPGASSNNNNLQSEPGRMLELEVKEQLQQVRDGK